MPRIGTGRGLLVGQNFASGPSWPPSVSGMTLLYDWRTDAGVSSSSGNLTSWTDQVAGIATTTLSGASAPTVVSNQINGQSCIRFDGTQALQYGTTGSATGDTPQVCTIGAVFKREANYADFGALIKTYSVTDNVQGALIYATTDTGVWGPFMSVVGTQKSSYTLSSYGVLLVSFTAATDMTLYTNDNAGERKTPGGAQFPGNAKTIGDDGSFKLHGDVAHIFVWSGAADATKAATIIDAAQAKWGL